MDQNLLNNFDESIKSKYTTKLYRTCFEMTDNNSCDIKMSTCLNLRPKNNFQILENLIEEEKPKKNQKITQKNIRSSNDSLIDAKDYKKLLVLKQKLQNSFRSKNNLKNNKSVFIDLKVPVISSSVINTSTTPASTSVSPLKTAETLNKRVNTEKISRNQQTRNGSILLNSKYLKKKIQLKQQEQELKDEQNKHLEKSNYLKEENVDQLLEEESKTLNEKNTLNSSKNVYAIDDFDYGDDEENANHIEINSIDSDESLTKQTNKSCYDLDCLKSICDTNKIYLKKLYNNFDIPILYCDSENQFKTDFIDEKDEQELEEQDKPLLKMNPIQFNYKNIRQPRSFAQNANKSKRPHWVNIATVGKLNDIRKPMQNIQNRRITSHLIAQKPEPSLIFVSTFSSLSTLSEYLKNKRPEDQNDQIPRKKSLGKIHSDEVYSDCRLKSKSAVVSPTSYYSVNNLNNSDEHENQYKQSYSDLNQYKLPDLITGPKLYVLNKNSLNTQQQKSKQSFITQTQVYKKLSELQRQNTFEYLKFVSVKNLKEQNDASKSNSSNKFVAPKISKKILLNETQAENIERQKNKNMKKIKSVRKKRSAPSKNEKNNLANNVSTRSCSTSSDDSEIDDETKMAQEEEHYEEDEDDDEDQEPDFVITQNSKSDQINDQEMGEDLEPKLSKSQMLYTHVLTSSSQLREFYHYSAATNSHNKSLNLILRNSFNNVQFRDAWEFMYNERKVRKLHQRVVENLEKQRSSNDIRLINFISSNLNYNNRSNFDCYKFYERSKTSNLLQNLRHKLYEQVMLANRLHRENTQLNNSELLEKSINLENSNLL